MTGKPSAEGAATLDELIETLERDRVTIERELAEIELLMRQAASEAERHEARRVQAEERLRALEKDLSTSAETLSEAHDQLLTQTRRQTLMQSQSEVLQGKQRALQRYHVRLVSGLPILRASTGRAPAVPDASERTRMTAAVQSDDAAHSREVMAAQEEMRREIARQMHDGPAQSIANIALQAQVVQRLFERDPQRAAAELTELVAMVQHALDATKSFIFDVRPMVLDDLGLVPTLRRAATERTRRTQVPVSFESVGSDKRLPDELESGLFRIVDDAVVGFLERNPVDIAVRLDWLEQGVRASVHARSSDNPEPPDAQARAALAAARRDRQLPAALASMIREQEHSAAAQAGLPESVWAEIVERAESIGIKVTLSSDGHALEASVFRG